MVSLKTTIKRDTLGNGFSLAELMITIAIVGILSAVGYGSYKVVLNRERVNALAVNVAGWLEQVRKAALLGAGCTATVNKNISSSGTIATSTLTSTSTSIERDCIPLLSTQDSKGALSDDSTFTIESNIMSSDKTIIQFTPRGTVILPTNNKIDIKVKLMPSGPTRCISIKNLIANTTISRGDSCGAQERF